jgi:hypothetical protein
MRRRRSNTQYTQSHARNHTPATTRSLTPHLASLTTGQQKLLSVYRGRAAARSACDEEMQHDQMVEA